MKSSGNKTGMLLLLVVSAGVAAYGLGGADSTTAESSHKPTARPAVRSTPSHPLATRTSTLAHHTATVRQTAYHSSTTHSATTHSAAAHPGATPTAHTYATTARNRTTAHYTASTTHRTTTTHTYRPARNLTGVQRLARLHLQPERAQEIQQALIREGYLQDGDASGQWDTRTHDAMLRYQTDHGFPATGLPEAKSLMKLGLGSHPLPPELDHGAAGLPAAAGAEGNLAGPPTGSPPISEATPPSAQ